MSRFYSGFLVGFGVAFPVIEVAFAPLPVWTAFASGGLTALGGVLLAYVEATR